MDKNSKSQERRKYERLPKKASIIYRHMDQLTNKNAGHKGVLCDFSGGGVRFLTDELITKNTQLVLNLEFTGWQNSSDNLAWTGNSNDIGKIEAIGVVMWCSKAAGKNGICEIGVRFNGRVS